MNTRSPRTRLVGATLVGLGLLGGTIGIANAQDGGTTLEPPATTVPAEPDTEAPEPESDVDEGAAHEGSDLDECFEWEPGSEEIAEIQAEMDALRAAFDEAGIAYTEELDEELGITFIEWDFDDGAANDVAESVYEELWGDDWKPGPEEIAHIQAEMDALRTAFDEAGIAYTEELDEELGITFIEWDFNDEAANGVVDAVLDGLVGGDVDFDLNDEQLAELAAEIQAEMDALRAAFDEAGIAYTEELDEELGVTFIEWDFDDEAANDVADSVLEGLGGGVVAGSFAVGDELPEDCEEVFFESCEDIDDFHDETDEGDDPEAQEDVAA
ncbi:MAG: hypothetical protein ACR2QE_13735 [Acidimicrobiales bacterium]